jgi:hypothetical protein
MSYIGESRKGADSPWELVLCLDESDCKLLLKAAEKIAIRAQKNYEKWRDIHEGGEMTTRQETAFMNAEEAREDADILFSNIKAFLYQIKKSKEHEKQIIGGDLQ